MPFVVDASSVAAQPWRNGGGRTRELLALPAGDGWRLRLSLADIEADGPFSGFPGTERWFAVVDGAGVVLTWPSSEYRLQAGDAPLRFDGAQPPRAALIGGATRDLNLMLRGIQGVMRPAWAGTDWDEGFACTGFFSAVAGRWSGPAGSAVELAAHALVWHDGPGPCRFDGPAAGQACGWWIGCSTSLPA